MNTKIALGATIAVVLAGVFAVVIIPKLFTSPTPARTQIAPSPDLNQATTSRNAELDAMATEIARLKKQADETRRQFEVEREKSINTERVNRDAELARQREKEEEREALKEKDRQLKIDLEQKRLDRERELAVARQEKSDKAQREKEEAIEVQNQKKKEEKEALLRSSREQNEKFRSNLKDGEILATIVVRGKLTTAVRKGTTLTFNNLKFESTRAFVGVTTAEAAKIDPSTQRLITQRDDGNYEFTIAARISPRGIPFTLPNDAKFKLSPEPPAFIEAYVPGRDVIQGEQRKVDVEAARRDAEAKIDELVDAAIPKYYDYLLTQYPSAAASRATQDVGGGKVVQDALVKRFQITNFSHTPPDTALDRELGTKAKENFEKLVSATKARYYEVLPTTTPSSAARIAAENSPRLDDLLRTLKTPIVGRKPGDLEVKTR